MQTKNKDIPYCGVDKDKILNAEPDINWDSVHHFKDFVIDRYRVHKRKDVMGLPAPWTKNPIITEFKFTNVRREHDRTTRYLIENVSLNDNLTLEDKIVNSFIFRAWNNADTFKIFDFPYSAEEIYSPNLKNKIRTKYARMKWKEPNRLWYNNAYNQGGTKCAWKFADADIRKVPYKFGNDHALGDDAYDDYEPDIPLRPLHVGVWLGRQHIVKKLLKSNNQKEAFEIIKSVRGFADFLAYQVFVDLTYIPEFPFSENEFTIAGPGCKKGLDAIFINKDGMTYEECIFWLRDKINMEKYNLFYNKAIYELEEDKGYKHRIYEPAALFSDLPECDRCINVMSLENCMCELSKYLRAIKGTGRPRNKYKPYRKDGAE